MPPLDDSTPGSLPHDFIDAEIIVLGLDKPTDEQALTTALNALPGIQSYTLSGGRIDVEYNPMQITQADLREAVIRAGYQVGHTETAAASPLTDALHPGPDSARHPPASSNRKASE